METRQDVRILLLEAREDPELIDHERQCLLRAGRLGASQIVPHDMLRTPPSPDLLEGFHAVMIGGTGDFSVARNRPPFFQPLVDLTLHLLEIGMPTLGLCYGHHLMGLAVGGEVQTRPDMGETGTFEVVLTEEGRRDPLLGHLPGRFLAQQGHHDAVLSVPAPFQMLATSQRCRWQALRHPDKPFYGLQFHPELGRADLLYRMLRYAETYASTPEKLAEIERQVQETSIQDVIARFIDHVVLPQAKGTPVPGPK